MEQNKNDRKHIEIKMHKDKAYQYPDRGIYDCFLLPHIFLFDLFFQQQK